MFSRSGRGSPLCPAGWGRSHPDKEFDSSNPVVRQAVGREGAASGWAGAYPSLASLWAGGAARTPPPQRPLRPKGQCPAWQGQKTQETETEIDLENRDPLDSNSETETQNTENQKSWTLRHSGTQRWRQTLKISDGPDTQRQM